MIRRLLPLVILGLFSGCCCWGNSSSQCKTCKPLDFGDNFHDGQCKPCKPPLNCLGSAYDGSSAPCYHPPGPFWCNKPGPCSTCRDPYLQCYLDTHAHWIGRYVCDPNASPNAGGDDDDEYMTAKPAGTAPRVIHQAKAEE